MTGKAFADGVADIAETAPTYRTGGTGMDGTCDCIGLVMGAMYALGHSEYPMHSSNYFARCEVDNLQRVDAMEDELKPGMLLFKARSDGNPRYDLHMRYRQGGRYFTGDLLDYYHVGVVTGVNPLEITHCTSTGQTDGIARDGTLDSWTHAGMVRGLDYREDDGGEAEEAVETAIVTAQSGSTVNLRERPGEKAGLLMRVPIGRRVAVLERASGWAHVQVDGTTGYMMEAFLSSGDASDAAGKDADMVTLHLPREAAMALYEAFTKVL
ncbi:MAG: SH3 domain-containing protein [Clostridia bacterium]|nr:SH3 domain-containing protein [Clostridia bacterium]